MGSGFKTFAASSTATSSDVQNYLMDQAVMSFASDAARNAAITTPEEGMVAYLQDSPARLTVYEGTGWLRHDLEWSTWSPSWQAVTTNPTIPGDGSIAGYYRRRDGSWELLVEIDCGTITNRGSGDYFFNVPSGFPTITNLNLSGVAMLYNGTSGNASTVYAMHVRRTGSNTFGLFYYDGGTNSYWGPTTPGSLSSDSTVRIHAHIRG